jgi:hypothetical protein
MNTTHAWIEPTMTAWPESAMAFRPNRHRLDGFSDWDQAELAGAFRTDSRSGAGCEPWADPMGRLRVDAEGAVVWVPPFLSCGYHDPVGISVDIDAECGGGFVTRPAILSTLAGGEVLHRLVRRARALVPPGRGAETVDVHAVRLRGGSVWFRSPVPPARATVAVLIAPSPGSSSFCPAPSAWGLPKLRRSFDTLAWTNASHAPSPADVIDGGCGDVLLIAFRG